MISNKEIGILKPPFIIAEMSGNHNQSLDRALKIVDAAAASGAHALKLQTYTADTMTLDISKREFFIEDPNNLWNGRSLYDFMMRLTHLGSGTSLYLTVAESRADLFQHAF
jgi:N-acetylneuraminate synthase